MCFVYFLNFIDKQTLNYANAYSFQADLGLVGNQYSWIASALNFGFLVFQYPANLALQKLPIGRYVGCSLVVAGVLLTCAVSVQNFGGMVVIRLLQGGAECCVGPAWMLLTSMFWTREEQPFRMSMWLGWNGIAILVGAAIAWAFGFTDSRLAPWRLIFLTLGLASVVVGVVCFFYLPGDPGSCVFFSEEEKMVAVWRVSRNRTGIKNRRVFGYQVREALTDPKVLLMALQSFCMGLLNGSITNFASSILKSFGLSDMQTNLYQMPAGGFEFVVCLLAGYFVSKVRGTLVLTIVATLVPGMSGMIGLATIPLRKGNMMRLIGCAWLQGVFGASYILTWALVSSNVAGHSKKTVVLTVIFVASSAGNIAGPFLFLPREAPRHITALRTLAGVYGACIFFVSLLGLWMLRQNRLRAAHHRLDDQTVDEEGFSDKTDLENKGFRYKI